MTALAYKIKGAWGDFWLDLELWWGKHFKSKPKPPALAPAKPIPPSVPAKPAPAPVVATAPKFVTPIPAAAPAKPKEQAKPKTEKPSLSAGKQSFSLRMLRLSAKERMFLFDQLSTLVGSGVTLIDSLNVIRAQTKQKGLKKLYADMIHHINAGMGLAQAMRLFPHVFPSMQVALIEAGEKSGNLKLVLADLVEDMETQQEFLRKITGAMFYPMLLLVMALGLVTGMMIFVIPRVAGMYAQAKVELPKLTQTMINISNFVRDQWPFLLGGIVGGIALLWLFFSKTRLGRLAWENFVGAFPIFGTIAKEKNLMIIAGNMAMLLKSGVLIAEAFQITQATLGNLHYQGAIERVRHDVIMGKAISESMGLKNIEDKHFKEDKLFPLQFSQLVHIGETTGTISQMLTKLRQNFRKSIDYKLKNISTLIEPLMILLVALLVGSILLAVMLPFFYIGTTIK